MPTTNTNQSDDGIVEPTVIIHAAACGHHHKSDCTGCTGSRDMNDDMLNNLRAEVATLEARLAAVEGEKAKVKADAIELCAFAADGLAEMARAGGITGRSDPLEATLLDEQFSQFAADLRRQKPQALGASL